MYCQADSACYLGLLLNQYSFGTSRRRYKCGHCRGFRSQYHSPRKLAHWFTVDKLAICHMFEFWGEFNLSGENVGNKRTFMELSDFFGVKLFLAIVLFLPWVCEHDCSRTYPLWDYSQYGGAKGILWNWIVHGSGFRKIGTVHDMGMRYGPDPKPYPFSWVKFIWKFRNSLALLG